MTKPTLIGEVLEELRQEARQGRPLDGTLANLPKGSRWYPGCPGDPACKVCEGRGYLRLDLPVGHRYFGKIFLCECTRGCGEGKAELDARSWQHAPQDS